MKNIRKIYLLILTILLIGPLISKANPVKILYVSAENQTGPVYDKINELITEELRACLQEKFTQKINSITWESMNPKSKLLRAMRPNYVLLLNPLPVIKGTEKRIRISFKFMTVSDTYEPDDEIWNNSEYNLELNSRQEPTNVSKLVADVCDEIDFYLNSSDNPDDRKFRPRIKISTFDVASGDIEEIDINEFGKWLNKILDDKYAIDPKYVFYYNRKYNKHYPENSVYLITGKISSYQKVDDNLVTVKLTIEFPEEAGDVGPAVIHSQEFTADLKRKDQLVADIINVLENNINYYGN